MSQDEGQSMRGRLRGRLRVPFFRFVAYLLIWLMAVQVWPFWELSQWHQRSHGTATRQRILAPLGGTSAEAGAVTVFGPRKYLRTTGKPNVYSDRFSATAGKATLVINQ